MSEAIYRIEFKIKGLPIGSDDYHLRNFRMNLSKVIDDYLKECKDFDSFELIKNEMEVSTGTRIIK